MHSNVKKLTILTLGIFSLSAITSCKKEEKPKNESQIEYFITFFGKKLKPGESEVASYNSYIRTSISCSDASKFTSTMSTRLSEKGYFNEYSSLTGTGPSCAQLTGTQNNYLFCQNGTITGTGLTNTSVKIVLKCSVFAGYELLINTAPVSLRMEENKGASASDFTMTATGTLHEGKRLVLSDIRLNNISLSEEDWTKINSDDILMVK